MIIELSIMKDNDYVYQTYSFESDHTAVKTQSIPSSLDSMHIIDFISTIMTIYNAANPAGIVSNEDLAAWVDKCEFHTGDKIRITDSNKSITITAISKDCMTVDSSGFDHSYTMYKDSLIHIGTSAYIPFYAFARLTGFRSIFDKMCGIVLVDDITGNIFSTIQTMKDIAEYVKSHHKNVNIEVSKYGFSFNDKRGNTDYGEISDYIYEAIIATHDSIYFSESYTSIQEQIDKERLTEDEIDELSISEYEDTLQYIYNSASNVMSEMGIDPSSSSLPHNIILVNADPYRDESYIPSEPDEVHFSIKELDPSTEEMLHNIASKAMTDLFSKLEQMDKDNEDGPVIMAYQFDLDTGEIVDLGGAIDFFKDENDKNETDDGI